MGFFPEDVGTRVVLLPTEGLTQPSPEEAKGCRAGVIVELRRQHYLKMYVVLCDDGVTRYSSACALAREDDPDATPFGVPITRRGSS